MRARPVPDPELTARALKLAQEAIARDGHPRKKFVCVRGHRRSPENLLKSGACRLCRKIWEKEHRGAAYHRERYSKKRAAAQKLIPLKKKPTKQRRRKIKFRGGTIDIGRRDAFHRQQRYELRRRAAAAHPDAGGTSAKFRKAMETYRKFLESEKEWYATYGLQPPLLSGLRG